MTEAPVRRGPGRRPGGPDTRGEILAAARRAFADKGFDAATIRGVARDAEVDPALVHHYFGSKEQLFIAAMDLPFEPAAVVPALLAGDRAELGERIVRFFLSVWRRPEGRGPFLALLRSATVNEQAAVMVRQFVQRFLLARIAAALDVPDARLRVEAAASHLIGLGLLRYVVRIEPLASADEDAVVALVAPAVQRYLTGAAEPPSEGRARRRARPSTGD